MASQRGDRSAEYKRTYEREKRQALELGFTSRAEMKRWLRAQRQHPNPRRQPPRRAPKGMSRADVIRAYRDAFEDPHKGFPSLTTRSEPLPSAVRRWYVDITHQFRDEDWDDIYGTPTR